ncbi:MAG: class I SAM-dependent methyltransferase [Deltaproteobacteria bacterium]|jgi:SAM-dependent methyltransferase|nr:class I SAM-dependent methyltransferase [Deltaproteobacteria bacterium]
MPNQEIDLRNELIPPPEVVMDGSSSIASYISVGKHFRKIFEQCLPLRPDLKVLEMGSAAGRVSRQFVNILSSRGEFTGIDIMPAPVEWCNRAIGARFPNFRFIHADIYNTEYNPTGKIKASAYTFPFEENSLDLVVLTSVFTHMLRLDVARYLVEIGRVLKPGGYCLATFFLFAREELARICSDESATRFSFPVYKAGGFPLVVSGGSDSIEEAVAYESKYATGLFVQSGLNIQKILPGNWLKSRENTTSFQDVVIAVK